LKLRVLATTDLHGHVVSWNYDTHEIAPSRGLSRLATLIAKARAEVEKTLLLDDGDFLNGSGLSAAALTNFSTGAGHPMVLAMNQLNFDAVAVGNHEFSHGLDFFRKSVAAAKFQLLCSNFVFSDVDCILPQVLLTREMRDDQGDLHSIKIGVLALLPRQTLVWEARHLTGCASAVPIFAAAQATAQQLRDMGADIVVALVHSGYDPQSDASHEESCAHAIAQIATIDVVLAGHSHKVFPETAGQSLEDVAVVMAGFYGSHLGVIDLVLQNDGAGWYSIKSQSAVRAVAAREGQGLTALVEEDPVIVAIAAQTHVNVIAASDRVVGYSDHRLHSYFALLSDSPALSLVAAAQIDHMRGHLTDVKWAGVPILAAAAPFKAGGRGGPDNYIDLPAGPLRIRHISDLYTHPNHPVAFLITGAELVQWLERSASIYRQITLGDKDAKLMDDDFPSFNFEVIFGISYQINLSKPARFDAFGRAVNPLSSRIESIRYDGQAVTADQPFILVSNSFRRDGGQGFAGTESDHVVFEGSEHVGTLVHDFVARGGDLAPIAPQR
jgi:2',3'-cyclic-nucleotide 2'-phosphodiesterase/3'-nucleotidase